MSQLEWRPSEVIEMSPQLRKLSRLINDMQGLEKELHKYERKYRLRSQDFYWLVQSGKLDQSPDYLMWLGVYETLQAREQEFQTRFDSPAV